MRASNPRRMRGGTGLAVLLILGLLAWTGCATAPRPTASGFLSDYQALAPDPEVDGLYWWVGKGINWQDYHGLFIDQVTVAPDPRAGERLDPKEAERLGAKLRGLIGKSLQGNFPLVARPAPGVMCLKVALVRVRPFAPSARSAAPDALRVPLEVGGAALEAKLSDSLGGRVMAELLMSDQGRQGQGNQVWTNWGQVEDAFVGWAVKLRRALMQGRP
ncbi:DUF3313 domain-containing protein [Desulfoferula mesophila]|uniref:Lipoprotein n=1 Tax=Desulfoferula mesophila TaxID=3058419 RepID=A0AAU9EIL5_9BACT|nr:hypothetical protein FAK_33780 [Desulfoferula mesophilus]